MRDKEPEVLGDVLVHQCQISATCRACDHRTSLSPAELAQRLGYEYPLARLERRLRCLKCGKKKARIRTVDPGR
jgi:transcription elongation factor Elf1